MGLAIYVIVTPRGSLEANGEGNTVSYRAILWFYLHQRGIQALLVGGCLLGFGLGQTLSINTGTHAQHTNMASSGRAAAIARSQAGGGLGNNVAAQQAVRVPSNAQIQGQPAATSAPSKGEAKHEKGQHKHKDGKGSGDPNSPKAMGHRQEDSGGPHGVQGKDNGGQGHDISTDGSGQTPSGGDH